MEGFVRFDDDRYGFVGCDDDYFGLKSALDAIVISYGVSDGDDFSRLLSCRAEVFVEGSSVFYNFNVPESVVVEAIGKFGGLEMIDVERGR